MKIRREQAARPGAAPGPANAKPPAAQIAPAKQAGAARKPAPVPRKSSRPRRIFSRFWVLTLGLLAGSGLCLFALAQWLILPDLRVGSLKALPAYNVVSQRADRADFWAVAQYHDATPISRFNSSPLFALDALSQLNLLFPLNELMNSRANGSLSAQETAVEPAWSHTNPFQLVSCTFWENIPCIYSTHTGQKIPGHLEMSLGRSDANERRPLCFTLLFLPDEAPDEQAFETAYCSVVDDLQQLCSSRLNSFHTLENLLANMDPEAFQKKYQFSARQALNLTDLAKNMGQLLEQLYNTGSFPYNLADPAQADALLQEYFQERGYTLQVLRLEDCYLVLISAELDGGSATLGIYYSPVLKTWCGIGLQLL